MDNFGNQNERDKLGSGKLQNSASLETLSRKCLPSRELMTADAGDLLLCGVFSMAFPSRCRKMLKLCGETEDKLAQELIHFELQVERDVIEPLFLLAEVSRTHEVTLFFIRNYHCLSTWSGLPDVAALPAACQLPLPATLFSAGIPVGTGAKLAPTLPSAHCPSPGK